MKKRITKVQKMIQKKLKPLLDFVSEMGEKNINVLAAGIAYFTLLAVFPAMAATMAIALFILDPSQVQTIMLGLERYVPKEITDVLAAILSRQAGQGSNLIMAIIGIALALFGASGAVENTTKALNVIYEKKERRNMVRLRLRSILFTVGAIILAASVVLLLLLSYRQLTDWNVPEWWALLSSVLRWPLMIVFINAAIVLLYRYGPDRTPGRWKLTSVGAATATAIWLTVTVAFFVYVQNFASLTQSYSVFAGIIALMIWFNLTAMAVLVGALVDARRTR